RPRPFVEELALVDVLVSLRAACTVRSGGSAFEMDHGGGRLVVNLAAGGAHGEGQVGVLVVRRGEACIEGADLIEQFALDGKACAGTVVDFAHVVVLGAVGVIPA